MTGSPFSADNSPVPATDTATRPVRVRGLWDAARALVSGMRRGRRRREIELARILDLFEEHIYAGEIPLDGRYVPPASMPTVEQVNGRSVPAVAAAGRCPRSPL